MQQTYNLVEFKTNMQLARNPDLRERVEETVAAFLSEGNTLTEAADAVGVPRTTLAALRRKFPDFAHALDQASFDGAVFILEELKQTPYSEIDVQRARVKIDALQRYLELRWPERFGKRMEVRIKTIDIGNALEKARTRAGVTIESIACAVVASDSESSVEDVDPFDEEIDPFDETPGG